MLSAWTEILISENTMNTYTFWKKSTDQQFTLYNFLVRGVFVSIFNTYVDDFT